MNPCFIITSALHSNIGIFDLETRIQQTKGTIHSIKKQCPNAKIIFIDGGASIEDQLINNFFKEIKSQIECLLLLNEDYRIKYLQNKYFIKEQNKEATGMVGASKTIAELIITKFAIEKIKSDCSSNLDRIFKLSGRYQLSPFFNPKIYEEKELLDKYVFSSKKISYMPNNNYCYPSVLWSFPTSRLDEAILKIENMINDITSSKNYTDLEHLLCKHIDSNHIKELDYVHAFGITSPTGYLVYH